MSKNNMDIVDAIIYRTVIAIIVSSFVAIWLRLAWDVITGATQIKCQINK